ncbi:MAG: EutN/CcmL family microcompartment protein [Planctomycetota bacterium]
MQLARVIGHTTATVKHESLVGQKLLIAQPLLADGLSPDGDPIILIDAVGAGAGELVMISSDGRFVRERLKVESAPARWSAIGAIDS